MSTATSGGRCVPAENDHSAPPTPDGKRVVLLVSRQPIISEGLRMVIDQQPNLNTIGITGELDREYWSTADWRPNIIVYDLEPSTGCNFKDIPELLRLFRGIPVLLLVSACLIGSERRALQYGAAGVVFREQSVQIFLKAIEKVSIGEHWFSRPVLNSLAHQVFSSEFAKIHKLTEREREVVALIAKALKNQDIADRLSISEATVRHHLTSIYQKLEVADRSELIVYAYENFLATPSS